jgi:hypothetical protein
VRPRSANEWRSFWHHGGEEQLEALLREVWTPVREVPSCRSQAERVALLLGSAAPDRALASELGRIRVDLGAGPDPAEDAEAAGKISAWFRSQA